MRKLRTALVACGLTALAAGTAYAATKNFHEMKVNLPDGTVAHISYVGNVAPTVQVVPANMLQADAASDEILSPIADMDRVSEMMDMQAQAMFRHMLDLHDQVMANAVPGTIVTSGNFPAGTVQYSYVSTTTGNGSCTQSVEWRSDGSNKQPQVIRTSSGSCDAVKQPNASPVVAASAPAETPAPAPHKV